MTWDDRIARLERWSLPYEGAVGGTHFMRVLLGDSLCLEEGIQPAGHSYGATLVWVLALGAVNAPKREFYGTTITEAIEAAEAAMLREHPDSGGK